MLYLFPRINTAQRTTYNLSVDCSEINKIRGGRKIKDYISGKIPKKEHTKVKCFWDMVLVTKLWGAKDNEEFYHIIYKQWEIA